MLCLDDGSFVEGVLDLAFRETAGWTIVELKTDLEIAARRAEYEAQIALYVRAVAKATGEEATGVLLRV